MRRFGAVPEGGATRFVLWAPTAAGVRLRIAESQDFGMQPDADGFFSVTVPSVAAGTRYMFRTDGLDVPDPASRGQASDADGWSVVPAASFGSTRADAIRPWHEAIIAEVHVGTASPEGTFAGLESRLDYYADAGFTALEIMPVADFAGRWNWGYDGVLPFAPDTAYGTPAELRRLVDSAHARGLGLLLDVVYNHFGPSGNYLPRYAGDFFTDRVSTPWGRAIDFRKPVVRQFFIENAVEWLRDYDFDGLRFDAVHAFEPEGGEIFLRELAQALRSIKPNAWLVLENDENGAHWLDREPDGRPRHYTAQWNDDAHHVLHVLATGETRGYYADFADNPPALLGRALAQGYVYQGEPVARLAGRRRGKPSGHLPPDAMVNFAQNHDQIGNRLHGDRLAASLPQDRLAFLRFVVMLSAQTPLFFMGEEVLSRDPFPFFADFSGDLADTIRAGRSTEFAAIFATNAAAGSPPDPLHPATMEAARATCRTQEDPAHAQALAEFRRLAEIRRALVWPLSAGRFLRAEIRRAQEAVLITWHWVGGAWSLAANPSDEAAAFKIRPVTPAAVTGSVAPLADGRLQIGPWSATAWRAGS